MPLPLLLLGAGALANGMQHLYDSNKASKAASVFDQYFAPGGNGEQLEGMLPGSARAAGLEYQAGGSIDDIVRGLEARRVAAIQNAQQQQNSDRSNTLDVNKFDYQRQHDAAQMAQQTGQFNQQMGNSDRDYALRAAENARQAAQQQATQGNVLTPQAVFDRTMKLQTDMRDEYVKASTIHTQSQQAMQQFMSAVSGDSATDITAAAIKLANLLDPGSVVRSEESGAWQGRGGTANNIATMMNEVEGKGATPKTREQLRQTALRIYKPVIENAAKLRSTYAARIQDANAQWGTNISQGQVFGGGYDPGYNPGAPALSQGEQDAANQDKPAPTGYTLTPPNARPWWQQLVNPGGQ